MANRSTAVRMTRLVARWRESDESGASFARRHRVRPWVLWYWSRKLRETAAASPTASSTFVPVRVVSDGAREIEIVLASGDRVCVGEGASPEQLRAVVSVLRSSC
jgi:transposase-like protein